MYAVLLWRLAPDARPTKHGLHGLPTCFLCGGSHLTRYTFLELTKIFTYRRGHISLSHGVLIVFIVFIADCINQQPPAGNDQWADVLKGHCSKFNVTMSAAAIDGSNTGVCIVISGLSDRTFVTSYGASKKLKNPFTRAKLHIWNVLEDVGG